MSVIGFHGDPCSRCAAARPGQPARAAAHHTMCMSCWLGATERQRRDAIFDESYDVGDRLTPEAAAQCRVLEALLGLPAVEPPHEQQWGEEDIAA